MKRTIPIFAPEQLPDDIREKWRNAEKSPVHYLECLPLKDDQGNIVCAGPVGFLTVED